MLDDVASKFPSALIDTCSPSKSKNGVNLSRPICGNIYQEFLKSSTRRRTKKPRKLPEIQGNTRGQGSGSFLRNGKLAGRV